MGWAEKNKKGRLKNPNLPSPPPPSFFSFFNRRLHAVGRRRPTPSIDYLTTSLHIKDLSPPALFLPQISEEMDASADVTSGATKSTPEYNTSSVKKARLQSTLAALLTDPVLADVPKKPSLSDVDTLINLELGSAMRITIRKLDSTSFEVVMMNTATVKDLKLVIKKKVNDMEESKMGHRHISWKHVWANFCLSYHNEKLLDDNSPLQHYGIRNYSEVQFTPYVVSRASGRHTKSRKHRIFRGLNRKS